MTDAFALGLDGDNVQRFAIAVLDLANHFAILLGVDTAVAVDKYLHVGAGLVLEAGSRTSIARHVEVASVDDNDVGLVTAFVLRVYRGDIFVLGHGHGAGQFRVGRLVERGLFACLRVDGWRYHFGSVPADNGEVCWDVCSLLRGCG